MTSRPIVVLMTLLVCLLGLRGSAREQAERPAFELADGDRVVFVGSGFFEVERRSGSLELLLTLQWPDRNYTFRNLSWSGDTVWGEARAGFDTAAEGRQRLIASVKNARPTVLILAYGANESFAGQAGIDRFKQGLNELLDAWSDLNTRVILCSPIAQEELGPPLPDPAAHNRALAAYASAIRDLAHSRSALFVDQFAFTSQWMKESAARRKTITENGGKFDVADHKGPFGPSDEASAGALVNVPLTVDGVRLKHWGNWVVALNTISALGMAEATAANSKNLDRYEPIRQAIIEKNRLVFDQWRPQNETYLFGFRKHEQGQNAREVEMFTPLIQAADDRIAALKASLNSSGSDGRGKESKP